MPAVKISVVVPVFNTQAYLPATLDALDKQSFRDFEVILIDDGSTDESPRILDDYCKGHERFRVIHTPNAGVYKSRMTGIRQAKGQYIAFCDSDDLYFPDMLEKLYKKAEKTGADITFCGVLFEDADAGITEPRPTMSFEYKTHDRPEMWDIMPMVNPCVWNKLYRADLLRHAIKLENPPRIAEDLLFNCSLFPFLHRIAFVPDLLYRYRMHAGSAVSRVHAADMDGVRENLLLTREYVLRFEDGPEMREMLDSLTFYQIGFVLVNFQIKSGERIRETVASARRWLDLYAPGYRKAGRTLLWNWRHDWVQLRILIPRWVFCAHLMSPCLAFFLFLSEKCGIKVKW